MKRVRHIAALAALTVIFWAGLGAGLSVAAGLDQNEEIQNVVEDLAALKAATQAYYSDSGNNPRLPTLSTILRYFDDDSLPPNASLLYRIKGGDGGWYVGYRADGLKSETYRQLEENANALGFVGDDLRSSWRRSSAYVWANALTFGPSSSPTAIRESNNSLSGWEAAAILLGAAAFIHYIRRDHRHHRDHHYSPPPTRWQWRGSVPAHRPPPRLRHDPRPGRPGAPRPPMKNPPARRHEGNRR